MAIDQRDIELEAKALKNRKIKYSNNEIIKSFAFLLTAFGIGVFLFFVCMMLGFSFASWILGLLG